MTFLSLNGIYAESVDQNSLENANSSSGSIEGSSTDNNSNNSYEGATSTSSSENDSSNESKNSSITSTLSTTNATSNSSTNKTTTTVSTTKKTSTKYYKVNVKLPYKYWYKKKVKVAHKKWHKKWYKYHGRYYKKWVKKTYYTYRIKWTYKIKYRTVTRYTATKPATAAAGTTKTTVKKTTSPYLKSTANCQVSSSTIKAKAKALTKGLKSTRAKANKIFAWVRDHINYSFYYNTKYGAKNTLKYKRGNCVDTAHLVVALSRAAGIQSRYMHVKGRFRSGSVYGHVIAEVKIGTKWYKADATSSRNSLGKVRSWTLKKLKGRYISLPF